MESDLESCPGTGDNLQQKLTSPLEFSNQNVSYVTIFSQNGILKGQNPL
jgi:hypothetical protein